MAQLVVRNLEENVKKRLQRRAARSGRSMEDEVRTILRDAVEHDDPKEVGLGTFIAQQFAGIGFDSEVPEWRGEEPRAAEFSKKK